MSKRLASLEDALSQSNIESKTLMPCRYKEGTDNDSDRSIPFELFQSSPIALCQTAGATSGKTATVQNFADFTLVSGRDIVVYFENGNSADNPTLNINNTGNIEIVVETTDSTITIPTELWRPGSFCRFKYVEIIIGTTEIKKWVLGASTTSIYNALSEFSGITSITQAEYDALPEEKKMADRMYLITDAPSDFVDTVDVVEADNFNAVTSNAVNGALTEQLTWKLVQSVTGKTSISLPQSFREILILCSVNYNAYITINIPYSILTENVQWFSSTRWYNNSNCTGCQFNVTKSSLILDWGTSQTGEQSNVTTTYVYYR